MDLVSVGMWVLFLIAVVVAIYPFESSMDIEDSPDGDSHALSRFIMGLVSMFLIILVVEVVPLLLV